MDYVLWLILATSVPHLPVVRSLQPDSLAPAQIVAAPRAYAGLGLAWPSDVGAFRPDPFAEDATPQRPRAIEHSDLYYARLTVHRIASLATVPLFVTEYFLGQKLISHPPGSSSTRSAHQIVALGLGGLFGVNTVTGVWNLWDSRKDPSGRARRYLHAALMMVADAGFVATASAAPSTRKLRLGQPTTANTHRALAIASMGTALASYLMMLVWKN